MIDVKVYNREGKELESLQVDETLFGGEVRYPLLKQAIVMYHANKRLGTAATKSRGLVAGSTRKLYKQKGTGNARAGTVRTPVRKGGGVAFAKVLRDFGKDMPKKQRRLACDSALLAKMLSGKLMIVDELNFDAPKTKEFARVLGNLKIQKSCLIAIGQQDTMVYKSARNLPKVDVTVVTDLNAGAICNKQQMLFTKEAFTALLDKKKTN
ncbi:MAG: 50S ribosomal protein L4 [Planctomycetaceae bacterium]|nr:50S ribosomal protein L4 [Planctomycetaceae bacterium]